jgi:periplasmic divalent cation tolerance protein
VTDFVQVQTTCSSQAEAERLAAGLVERRLAACVQLSGPVTSVYRWQGAIETGTEWLLKIKTRSSLFIEVEQAIRSLHSYETPQIIALPIVAASEAYASWLDAELAWPNRTAPPLLAFHVTLHARPPIDLPTEPVTLGGREYTALRIPNEAFGTPFNVSFEEVLTSLAQLERLFIEPDGSFVWASPADEEPWQVDGVLYDRADRLLYVDLQGCCPVAQFNQMLSACGWPATRIVFQLVMAGVFLDEDEFRRHASEQQH